MRLVTFFDLETTGKLHPDHRIIEASFRICDLDKQVELKNKLWRFNPQRNIDAKAFAVHGITVEELKHEPLIIEHIPNIISILKTSTLVVGHNSEDFDLKFLEIEFKRNGFDMPEVAHFDTMKNGNFATELGKSPSLKELAWAANVNYDDKLAHSGDYDTLVLRDSFFNLLNDKWYNL